MKLSRLRLRKLILETILLEKKNNSDADPYSDLNAFKKIVQPIMNNLGMKFRVNVGENHYYVTSIAPEYSKLNFGINNSTKQEMLQKHTAGKFVLGMPISGGSLGSFTKPFSGDHIATILSEENSQGYKFKSVKGYIVLDS